MQGDAHVGGSDGEHGHAAARPMLEDLTQLLALGRRGAAIDADKRHALGRTGALG